MPSQVTVLAAQGLTAVDPTWVVHCAGQSVAGGPPRSSYRLPRSSYRLPAHDGGEAGEGGVPAPSTAPSWSSEPLELQLHDHTVYIHRIGEGEGRGGEVGEESTPQPCNLQLFLLLHLLTMARPTYSSSYCYNYLLWPGRPTALPVRWRGGGPGRGGAWGRAADSAVAEQPTAQATPTAGAEGWRQSGGS